MAEFQEVMRQWERMCRARTLCNDGCPIKKARIGCNVAGAWEASKEIENLVMKWAEEHSEPIYPTWGEWFLRTCQVGLTPDFSENDWFGLLNSRIPAETAEKLGIPPEKKGR